MSLKNPNEEFWGLGLQIILIQLNAQGLASILFHRFSKNLLCRASVGWGKWWTILYEGTSKVYLYTPAERDIWPQPTGLQKSDPQEENILLMQSAGTSCRIINQIQSVIRIGRNIIKCYGSWKGQIEIYINMNVWCNENLAVWIYVSLYDLCDMIIM